MIVDEGYVYYSMRVLGGNSFMDSSEETDTIRDECGFEVRIPPWNISSLVQVDTANPVVWLFRVQLV